MGVSSDADQAIQERLKSVCLALNMDRQSSQEALQTFDAIGRNYTLEGDCRHWLACSLYVACRLGSMPTVGATSNLQGNCVSLRGLLSTCELDLLEFFRKMEQWSDMVNLDSNMRRRLSSLRESFNVTTIVFSKFHQVFGQIFKGPPELERSGAANRGKRHRGPTTVMDLYRLCWLLYIALKSRINTETVSCFHLLLCCLDFVYVSCLHADRTDLLNQDFYQEQLGKCTADGSDLKVVGLLRSLCETHKAVFSDANILRIYYLQKPIKELVQMGTLKGSTSSLSLSIEFKDVEHNIKSLKQSYELSVLRAGELDEQVFLAEDACQQIGVEPVSESEAHDTLCRSLVEYMRRQGALGAGVGLQTPLTGRGLLTNREPAINLSPVSTATQGASKLHSLLIGRNHMPSETLSHMFAQIVPNPAETIDQTIKEMGEIFCKAYAAQRDDDRDLPANPDLFDFAKKRLALGEALFYKILEAILTLEHNTTSKPLNNFSVSLRQEQFQRSLFASCLEIVMLSYNSKETLFPWILNVFGLKGYDYYRIIEPVIRSEQQLSRDVVKHFNRIEEQILECIAWRSDSPVWEQLGSKQVPQAQQVLLPSQLQVNCQEAANAPQRTGPVRLMMTAPGQFMEMIPAIEISAAPAGPAGTPVEAVKGSWGLFFRKVYFLASVRLRHLCASLQIPDEHLAKAWTMLEHVMVHETSIFKDRHLDQVILCCVYALCKLFRIENTFLDITQSYKSQPNSQSHVYRSVLITPAQSSTSGESPPSSVVTEVAGQPTSGTAPPPTPGGMAGTSQSFEDGQRGDIIKFYNCVFVPRVRPFLLSFRSNETSGGLAGTSNPLLSPLPRAHGGLGSPKPLQVTNDLKVFVSSYKGNNMPATFNAKTFRIQQSPAKDLVDINKMVQRRGEEMAAVRGTKRSLDMDGATEGIPKRLQNRFQTMFVQQASPQHGAQSATVQQSR
ncbi:retinoblastoma-like protein 2 isoform X2 [Varroa jacobsoni]|uniref:Retinoblastoma-like protein 1 n=1 Tax=Varroa destructor TaxID=109461 RepID=A0A7M7KV96_VARDE|nr:retinoblastoma-like protein 2 isoform X2 [Varroa destructor]XP_022703134.1 retinoblastoma-like protein 2 isoform X2 [Varroa jacobsoni]